MLETSGVHHIIDLGPQGQKGGHVGLARGGIYAYMDPSVWVVKPQAAKPIILPKAFYAPCALWN